MINHDTGTGWEEQTNHIHDRHEQVSCNRHEAFHCFRIEDDAVQQDDDVGDVENEPGNVAELHKAINLSDGAT